MYNRIVVSVRMHAYGCLSLRGESAAKVKSNQIMYGTKELGAALQQRAVNDPDEAHLKTLTFDYTHDGELVDAVLSGTDGIYCSQPLSLAHKHRRIHDPQSFL